MKPPSSGSGLEQFYMALFLTKELENEATIYVWEITETEQELMDMCSIPNNELEELSMIRSEARRKEAERLYCAVADCTQRVPPIGTYGNEASGIKPDGQPIIRDKKGRFTKKADEGKAEG